jgi:chemotaxis protein methyltransferase CheR
MSPQVFSILSGLVAERTGLHFEAVHSAIFAEKVGRRVVEAGFESFLDYYYYLRYDAEGGAELDRLVEGLVVGETYLFRELAPLQTAVASFVVPALEAGRRPRVWCAASATGEEPHTVAMLLQSRGILDAVDPIASDISVGALERARRGRFTRRALRSDVPAFAAPWIDVGERDISVDSRLTKAIDWRRINLIDEAAVAALGRFDVILCRNVLIYFDDTTTRKVVDRLATRLIDGGALFVGISESLLRFRPPLLCEERDGVFLYRKVS